MPQAPGESERGLGLTAQWTHVRTLLIMLKIVLKEGMDFVGPLKFRMRHEWTSSHVIIAEPKFKWTCNFFLSV